MSLINTIENKIKELSGGEFQKLGDAFLAKKFPDYKLIALGSQEGTNKTTRGIPDTYLVLPNGKQIFVMYGTHSNASKKIAEDIKSAKEKIEELGLGTEQIEKIICCHTSSNIGPEKKKKFEEEASPFELELIGINEIANTLYHKAGYQYIAKDILGVSESTDQVWDIESFVKIHDQSKTNAPISNDYLGGSVDNYVSLIESDIQVLLIADNAGVGKTRLGIEICNELKEKSYDVICVKSNGQATYQDLKRFIDSGRDTVVFIDDVNLVLDYKSAISLLNFYDKLKFILTCRLYSRDKIKPVLKDCKYREISVNEMSLNNKKALIKQFSDENINPRTIQNLIEIRQSNPRLLVLAAILSKQDRSKKYDTQYEILGDYYEDILSSNEIDSEDEVILFIIHFVVKLNYKEIIENSTFSKLADFFQVEKYKLDKRINGLYRKEIIDIYHDYICKIADQTLGDYIAVKFLSSRKSNFKNLFALLYNLDNKRFLEILEQVRLYYDEKDFWDTVSDSVRTYYSGISHDDYISRENFLLIFSSLIPTEAIKFVNDQIKAMVKQDSGLALSFEQIYEFEKGPVNDNLLKILRDLVLDMQDKRALELLFEYQNQNKRIIGEAYSVLVRLFNSHVVECFDFAYLENVVESASSYALENSSIKKQTILLFEKTLQLKHEFLSRPTKGGVEVISRIMPEDPVFIACRKKVLEQLYIIYESSNQEVKKEIMTTLLLYAKENVKYSDKCRKIIDNDLLTIKETFFCKMKKLSLYEENVLFHLNELAMNLKNPLFNDYVVSERQKVYHIISNSVPIKTENEPTFNFFDTYSGQWDKFFEILKVIDSEELNRAPGRFNVTLFKTYSNLSFEEKCKFLQAMLEANYNIGVPNISYFFDSFKIKPDEYHTLLHFIPNPHKKEWTLAVLLSTEKVTKNEYDALICLLKNYKVPTYYSIKDFFKYIEYCPCLISKEIIQPESELFWIPNFNMNDSVKSLLKYLDVEQIENSYLLHLNEPIDENCALFFELCKENTNFGVEVLKEVYNKKYFERLKRIIGSYLGGGHDYFEEVIIMFVFYIIRRGDAFDYPYNLFEYLLLNPQTVAELLNKTLNEEEFIKLLNISVGILETDEIIELYKLMKSKGYGTERYEDIVFIKDGRFFCYKDSISLLEKQVALLERIKRIFSDSIKYIDLVSYLDVLIEDTQKNILIKKESEF